MTSIQQLLEAAKCAYERDSRPLPAIKALTMECLSRLETETMAVAQPSLEGKKYVILGSEKGRSRPILPSLFLSSPLVFSRAWDQTVDGIDSVKNRIEIKGMSQTSSEELVNKALYTCVVSLAACYDIWKPQSRKTPGTFFEVVLGTLLSELLPLRTRSKHIPLPGTGESVSTDIVFSSTDSPGLVFPAKITTRERIVQPFAHQRILDSFFGDDKYRSIILCISETQRDDVKNRVNDICVPGTIRLFQRHLASIDYLCYADPPTRYLQKDVTEVISVKTLGWLFATGLPLIAS